MRHPAAQATVVLAMCLAAVCLLHRKMNPEMLRSEAGYFQNMAHSSAAQQKAFVRSFWTRSSHGHYTPLAFTAEFYFAKFAGLRPNIWRARQLLFGALVAFCLFGFARAAARHTQVSEMVSNGFAAGVTLVFLAQPVTREILDVLFHGIQLGWMALALTVGWSFARLGAADGNRPHIWPLVLIAYSSMHVLGLGLGVVAGTVAALGVILLGIKVGGFDEWRPHLRTVATAVLVLVLVGGLHTIAMIALNNAAAPPGGGRTIDWRELVGLFALTPVAIGAGLFGAQFKPLVMNELLSASWPFAVAILLSIAAFILILFAQNRRRRVAARAPLLVAVFSAVLFCTLIAMISVRELQEPTPSGLYGYLIGARYVLPMTIAWLGLAMSGVMLLRPRQMAFVALVACILGVGAVASHVVYDSTVRPRTAALGGRSHLQVWRNLVQVAREARSAGLPVPNLSLQRLSLFPFVDLKYLEPLLRDELGLQPDEQVRFVAWAEVRDQRLAEYSMKCPTLLKTARLLELPLSGPTPQKP